ncbi:hypothetical protein [Komagataeibacter swingsii]|uniref:hypothetical protein n=1 Tax=Komagataeibacter swingsii TaxID=215220 RepID=UPI00222FF04C|nr:hypothetical protein [Komagataeibacter swingsii]
MQKLRKNAAFLKKSSTQKLFLSAQGPFTRCRRTPFNTRYSRHHGPDTGVVVDLYRDMAKLCKRFRLFHSRMRNASAKAPDHLAPRVAHGRGRGRFSGDICTHAPCKHAVAGRAGCVSACAPVRWQAGEGRYFDIAIHYQLLNKLPGTVTM